MDLNWSVVAVVVVVLVQVGFWVTARCPSCACRDRKPWRHTVPPFLAEDDQQGQGGQVEPRGGVGHVAGHLARGMLVPEPLRHNTSHWQCGICSHAHKFCYIKIAKSASSTMQQSILPDLVCPSLAAAAAHGNASSMKRTIFGCPPMFDTACKRLPDNILQLKDYFVFSVVRNPIDRARSSYFYLSQFVRWKGRYPTLQEFCDDPSSLQGKHTGGPSHWEPQILQVVSKEGVFLADYIGAMEALETTVGDIVAGIDKIAPCRACASRTHAWMYTSTQHGKRVARITPCSHVSACTS